jgi:hypothetical protein
MILTADRLLHYARIMLERRDLPAALAAFDRAQAAGVAADTCAAGRWMTHMLAGNFAAAWRESDAIRSRGAPDPHRFWEGQELTGQRVIVRCLHGCGDAVQFLRYAPLLRARASRLIIEVAPPMVQIARCFQGVDEVVTWGNNAPLAPPRWDVQVEVVELPYLFRTEPAALPLAVNYLHLPDQPAIAPSGRPAVGLVWAAGNWNTQRSIPFTLLQPLLHMSEYEFWNLQGGCARGEWEGGLACGDGIMELASAIARMDLVITVDTLAAHLAGAMGKPAWVLLQYAADWRWMTSRSDSLWYPSLRLFRQPRPGDWESAVGAVQQELKRRVQKAA